MLIVDGSDDGLEVVEVEEVQASRLIWENPVHSGMIPSKNDG